jgi:hypothetical protein
LSEQKKHQELYYFGYFKKLYESWEASTNKMMDVWMNSPFMDRAVEKSTEFKDYIHNFIEKSLENRYLPEGRDVSNLIETINSLEAKVAELEKKIDRLESTPKKTTTKRRTRSTQKKVKEKKQ